MIELFLDVQHGATAEALLGALIDAGASLEEVEAAVATLGHGEVKLQLSTSPAGSSLRVRAPQGAPRQDAWGDLRPRVALLALDEVIVDGVLATLDALFAARGEVHGVAPAEVDVDPFSGPDDLADAVALAAATHSLAPERVTATAVGHGTGTMQTVEGAVELPGPVVAALLVRTGSIALDHHVAVVDPVGAAFLAAADGHAVDPPDPDPDDPQGRGRLPDDESITALLLTHTTSPSTTG